MKRQNTSYRIPRYLGLSEARENKGQLELELGFTPPLRRSLSTDLDGARLLSACLAPKTETQLKRETGLKPRVLRQALKDLGEAGVIKPVTRPPRKFERYDRHLLFYDLQGVDAIEAQRKISKARIALIGMGGIGSWVSLGLIGAGFKELKLMDFDVIELSNLTRQVLYTEQDVGKRKTAAAEAGLRARNSQTKITPVETKVGGVKDLRRHLRGMDFVIISADRPAQIHDWVDEVCMALNIPYINLGYRDGRGVVGPMTVRGKTSCYQCFKPKAQPATTAATAWTARFENRYQAPSFGPLNAIVSSTGVLEVMKFISGIGSCRSLGVELEIDPMSLEIATQAYPRSPNCWHCGE